MAGERKIKLRLLTLCTVCGIFFSLSFAQTGSKVFISQEVITPFGNIYNNNFQIVHATLGEPVIQTVSDNLFFILTQGFQQPLPIEKLPEEYTVKIDIYPNPLPDGKDLSIVFYVRDIDDFIIEITDIVGKLIFEKEVSDVFSGQKESINIDHLAEGIYLVHVFSKKEKMASTKKITKY